MTEQQQRERKKRMVGPNKNAVDRLLLDGWFQLRWIFGTGCFIYQNRIIKLNRVWRNVKWLSAENSFVQNTHIHTHTNTQSNAFSPYAEWNEKNISCETLTRAIQCCFWLKDFKECGEVLLSLNRWTAKRWIAVMGEWQEIEERYSVGV